MDVTRLRNIAAAILSGFLPGMFSRGYADRENGKYRERRDAALRQPGPSYRYRATTAQKYSTIAERRAARKAQRQRRKKGRR